MEVNIFSLSKMKLCPNLGNFHLCDIMPLGQLPLEPRSPCSQSTARVFSIMGKSKNSPFRWEQVTLKHHCTSKWLESNRLSTSSSQHSKASLCRRLDWSLQTSAYLKNTSGKTHLGVPWDHLAVWPDVYRDSTVDIEERAWLLLSQTGSLERDMDSSWGANSVRIHSSGQWVLELMETWMPCISHGPHSSIQKQGTSWATWMFLAVITQESFPSGKWDHL